MNFDFWAVPPFFRPRLEAGVAVSMARGLEPLFGQVFVGVASSAPNGHIVSECPMLRNTPS